MLFRKKKLFSQDVLSKSVSEQRATTAGHEQEQQSLPLLRLPGLQVGLTTREWKNETGWIFEAGLMHLIQEHLITVLLMCVVYLGVMLAFTSHINILYGSLNQADCLQRISLHNSL